MTQLLKMCWLMFLAFCCGTLLDIASASSAAAVDLTTKTESLSLSSENAPESGFRLKFLQKPATELSTDNNDAGAHKKGELYLRHRDNEEDNNDGGVSSTGLRYRRDGVNLPSPPAGGSKVITTNWGTYEEQAPVVIESANDANVPATGDEEPIFSDEVQSRESPNEYGSEAGVGSISYEEYEDGHFEGRQFYPSRGGGYGGAEEQEQPEGYYRQKYYSTTPKATVREEDLLQGEQSSEGMTNRLRYQNRGQYRTPGHRQEEQEESPGIMGFVEKAKTFYDIFRAMNSAWKSIEDRYRKNGEGVFLGEAQPQPNATTASSSDSPVESEKTTKNPRLKAKKRKTTTTKAPTTLETNEDEEPEEQRSRRSSLDGAVNGQQTATTSRPETESSSDAEDTELESESDLESSASDSTSSASSSTAVAEGRYIKGDPLKGYYDFVITEGSYKFWAAFQVGTAILIIYSTFAAIYYSKVNPLVSDYDYIDYLGGGRSLSDDSDFVDTDAPAAADDATNSDGSKKAPASSKGAPRPGGGTARSQRLLQQQSAGWFDWVPHAGHTLRFILEAIDKGYTEE